MSRNGGLVEVELSMTLKCIVLDENFMKYVVKEARNATERGMQSVIFAGN